MDRCLAALRALAEPTRLRLVALCAQGELAAGELVEIVGQSQPRVSRHLRLLCEGGVLDRFREGAYAFYRIAAKGPTLDLVRDALAAIPATDPLICGDLQRLSAIKQTRAEAAASYFSANAARWAELRSLHIDEAEVETALKRAFAGRPFADLLDIGTGTGRMLEVLGPMAKNAQGVDLSREMLAIARARLDGAGLQHCGVRQSDMYALPFADSSFDAVVIHQVLHFADRPAAVVQEAARVLREGGRLAIVDFAPHDLESLRTEHNHRRLGFAEAEVARWCKDAGLPSAKTTLLLGNPLTVAIWLAGNPAETVQKKETATIMGDLP